MRPLLLALLTLALLALSGCGADTCNRDHGCRDGIDAGDAYEPEHLRAQLIVDPELSAAEVEALHAAVDAWRAATSDRASVSLMLVEPGAALPERLVVRRARAGELTGKQHAAYYRDAIAIGPLLEASPHATAELVHELGHFFGLGHEDNRADVMYPFTHDAMPSGPTPDAIADLAAIYEWP